MATLHREACIEAINTYHREHGLVPLVVCSRSSEYLAQKTRLQLGGAVVVQPLTIEQVDDSLALAGEQMKGIRLALRNDPVLQELIRTPLLLSVLILAYQGKLVENLVITDDPTARRQRILADYVQRMLQRKSLVSDGW